MECLEALMADFAAVAAFARYEEVRADFLALALKTLLFLEFRLDATAAQDPTGAYLFENPDGSMPLEKELQQDYFAIPSCLESGHARRSKRGSCGARGCLS
jgi:hypothetical protein